MAKVDIGLYVNDNSAVMVPKSDRAKAFFKEEFKLPESCDGMDVTEIGTYGMLELLPRHFIFGGDKKEPKKIHKLLLQ